MLTPCMCLHIQDSTTLLQKNEYGAPLQKGDVAHGVVPDVPDVLEVIEDGMEVPEKSVLELS